MHRFYQMWQQLNCNIVGGQPRQSRRVATATVPLGRRTSRRRHQWRHAAAANFSTEYSPTATTTGEGSTALGFYNVQQGDVPYFKSLADNYAMSDNFHQSVNGGTGANHIMLGHGDAIWFSDGNGNPAAPPNGQLVFTGTPNAGIGQRGRESESGARHQQLVHRGRLRRSYNAAIRRPTQLNPYRRRLLQRLLGSHAARRRPIVSYLKSLPHPSIRTASRATTIC